MLPYTGRMKRIKRLARRFWLPLTLLVVVAAILLLLVRLAFWGYQAGWTGFGPSPEFPKSQPITIAQPKKLLWDWLQLISALLVPIVVAGVGVWFTHRLRQTETEISKDRQQEDDLLAYVDRMSGLLIEKHLATHESTHEVRLVARVLTTTALRQLLAKRRRDAVLRFLTAADLINTAESQHRENAQDPPVVSFLRGANLQLIDWSKAPLAGADLHGASLTEVDLTGADLTEADLTGADLTEADLTEANLHGANLRGAILIKSKLGKADLRGAKLRGADLTGADLTGARLRGAKVTNEQLNTALSLAGVILPKGGKLPDDFKGRLP
jgi:uncharacterized protein YjbI with pentapeptide repeats